MMKKILLGLAGVAALSTSALAADLSAPVYTKAPVVALYDWTGFYIGANGGLGEGQNNWQFAVSANPTNQHSSGALAGGQAGYNWQQGRFVFGLEADGDWANLKSSASCPNTAYTCFAKVGDLASFRARVGWAPQGPVLLYVTGGAGYDHTSYGALNVAGNGGSGTGFFGTDRWGYAVGAGLEYGLTQNWSIKAEYLHYGFGNVTSPAGTLSGNSSATLGQNIDTLKFGVNYRFGGPVVARF